MTTHSIWSKELYVVIDGDTNKSHSNFEMGDAALVWTENTRGGYCHAVAQVASGQRYEFTLVAIGSSDADTITGLWDVKRNGTLVCSGCVGQANNLSMPVGEILKIYIGTPTCYEQRWHFSGYITDRYDF